MAQTDSPAAASKRPMFIIGNFTVESIALRLKALGSDTRTYAGFGAWRTALLADDSEIWGGTAVLLLHGAALFPGGADANFKETLDDALSIIRGAAGPDRTLIVSTLDIPEMPARPIIGENFAAAAENYWRESLERMGASVFDLKKLVCDIGRRNFYSAKTWYAASLPFSAAGEKATAAELARIAGIMCGRRKKCLVLDLDNTLWGGVISEDGLDGIALAAHGTGAVYQDVQRTTRSLREQGVLLAVSSKNFEEDARLPFMSHPNAILREEDFAVFAANWQPKPDNIRRIAETLNIGTDSLVFIDDNPAERAAVKAAMPEVTVPDFPADVSALPAFMAAIADEHFTAPRILAEDAEKAEMYNAEAKRAEVRASASTLDDYLASLEMKLDVHRLREDEVSRAAQLCAKTNQFNLTTIRHTETDISTMMHSDEHALWCASLRDKYGDYGRIALVTAHLHDDRADIETFLMSCRAMGRGVESALLSAVEADLSALGVRAIYGRYVPTAKNEPVKNFWRDMGYAQDNPHDDSEWSASYPFPERRNFVCLNSL